MQYFNPGNDVNISSKLNALLGEYGLEGYGLYFYCVKLIVADRPNPNITFDIDMDVDNIARDTELDRDHTKDMMTYMVEQDLFEMKSIAALAEKFPILN